MRVYERVKLPFYLPSDLKRAIKVRHPLRRAIADQGTNRRIK